MYLVALLLQVYGEQMCVTYNNYFNVPEQKDTVKIDTECSEYSFMVLHVTEEFLDSVHRKHKSVLLHKYIIQFPSLLGFFFPPQYFSVI